MPTDTVQEPPDKHQHHVAPAPSVVSPAGGLVGATLVGTIVRTVISLAIVAGGAAIMLQLGVAEPEPAEDSANLAPVVEVASVVTHNEGVRFTVDGEVVAHREVELAAQVAGVVVYRADACRVGRAVRQGELLIKIEATDYEIEVLRLEEQLKQARGALAELGVEVENATGQIKLAEEELVILQRDLQRYQSARDPGVFSQSEVDVARRSELASRNALQGQRNQLRLLEARRDRIASGIDLVQQQLAKANIDLQRTEIRAPLDGIVTMEHVEQDGYVQKGSPMVTIQSSTSLDVTCSLYMQQMDWLWQSAGPPTYRSDAAPDSAATPTAVDAPATADNAPQPSPSAYEFPKTPVKVRYELNGATYIWDGVLERFDGSGLDPATRMIPCRVHIAQPTKCVRCEDESDAAPRRLPPTLLRGMFVQVDVTAKPPLTLVRLPERAVRPGNIVWVVRDGKLQRTVARVAQTMGAEVLVHVDEDSPQAGDQVVVSPLALPVEGLEVDLRTTS